ncbi:MAG TPA: LTA synthase family protein, partial [Gemmatimonadales bacterium]|nr:LTA synthase family protein [Gemmatimonadales bacterium]
MRYVEKVRREGPIALTFAFGARAVPEAALLLAVVGMTAGWATLLEILPGRRFGARGATGQALLWICLYAGVALAYRRIALDAGESVRSAWRRLGLCLLLALLSAYVCQRLLGPILAPIPWRQYFYLSYFLPFALVALWCRALLPQETHALVGAVTADATIAPLPQLAALLAAAAVLVSGADLAFQWGEVTGVASHLQTHVIWKRAWASNTLILFGAYALVFALVPRVKTALLVVSPLYVALGIATLVKLHYMHSAVQPLDVLRLPEFLPLFRSFFGAGTIVAVVVLLGMWTGAILAGWKSEHARVSPRRRWAIGSAALACLLAFPAAILYAAPRPWTWGAISAFGAPTVQYREQAREHGVLLSFLSELPAAFVSAPPGYSPAAVARAASKYQGFGASALTHRRGRVNLIVYMIESFMDPDDLGLRFTGDPVPNFHAIVRQHSGGHVIVPEEFGGSANTEFELLTGMTRSFLPSGSLPYREYLRRPIPSLPRTLGDLGYTTTAVQADPKFYYDRERAYPLLGFQHMAWLGDSPSVPHIERVPFPHDSSIVDAVVAAAREAGREARPYFIFAFPSSTHSPYNRGTYRRSPLGVIDSQAYDASGEVKEYVNALHEADWSIGALLEYVRQRSDSTIIVIFGDHMPPLTEPAYRTFFAQLSRLPESEQARMRRRVPLAIWANFELARGEARREMELSVSALPAYLLERMGLAASGLLAVTDSLRRRLPVLPEALGPSRNEVGGRDTLAADTRMLLTDYRLLQYDLL